MFCIPRTFRHLHGHTERLVPLRQPVIIGEVIDKLLHTNGIRRNVRHPISPPDHSAEIAVGCRIHIGGKR